MMQDFLSPDLKCCRPLKQGMWVSYVNPNPTSSSIGSGHFEPKKVWVAELDKLPFASWFYINTDDFTCKQVSFAVDNFHEGGLPETVGYFPNCENAVADVGEAADYHNAAGTVEGRWFAFMGGPHSKIAVHSDPSMFGRLTPGDI